MTGTTINPGDTLLRYELTYGKDKPHLAKYKVTRVLDDSVYVLGSRSGTEYEVTPNRFAFTTRAAAVEDYKEQAQRRMAYAREDADLEIARLEKSIRAIRK